MRNPFRPRWAVALVGQESGSIIQVTFICFRRRVDAERWVDRMNANDLTGLTRWEVRKL